MTTDTGLPLRPAGGPGQEANAQYAATRTREDRPSRVPRGAAVQAVLSGASPLYSPPPSIMEVWGRHKVSARFYASPLLWRWPRYAYCRSRFCGSNRR